MSGKPIDAGDATLLCNACGLCCNGALFDYVPVEESESERLKALGFAVRVGPEGGLRFDHPCQQYCGDHCGIYALRPASCRSFRCELLKKLDSKNVSLAEAMKRVAEAKQMVEHIRPSLKGQGRDLLPKNWTELFNEWRSRPAEGRSTPSETQLVLELTRLNRFLDRHFRSRSQHQVVRQKLTPGQG
jgi:Fe-S-cluster containining protein